jgi:hypothetical protein
VNAARVRKGARHLLITFRKVFRGVERLERDPRDGGGLDPVVTGRAGLEFLLPNLFRVASSDLHEDMRPECRPRDLEIQVARAAGMGGPPRSALIVREDGGTGPITSGSGRMGSKDPVAISGCMSFIM